MHLAGDALFPNLRFEVNMVRKKDSLWAHAEELANKFKCKYCDRVFSGGLTRLKYHLSGLKGHDVDTCTQVPDDIQAQAYLSFVNKKRKPEGSGTNMEESVGGTNSSPSVTNTGGGGMFSQTGSIGRKGIHQSTMPQMAKKMDKSEVDRMVAKFFIQNNIAFNVVQQKTLIDLVKGIAEVGPSYKLPSYSTLRGLWWEFCGDPLPVLQKYAIRILSQPCSSSSCERNWSAFEAAQTKKRNRRTPNMLGLLVYCRMNTMMMEKFHDKVLKDADPIDLTNLTEWTDYGEEVESCPPTPLDEGEEVLPEISQDCSTSLLTSVCVSFVDGDDNDAFDPRCGLDYEV